MFKLLKRIHKEGTIGNWFSIWQSQDGADTASYMKQCVESDTNRKNQYHEYKMIYCPEAKE